MQSLRKVHRFAHALSLAFQIGPGAERSAPPAPCSTVVAPLCFVFRATSGCSWGQSDGGWCRLLAYATAWRCTSSIILCEGAQTGMIRNPPLVVVYCMASLLHTAENESVVQWQKLWQRHNTPSFDFRLQATKSMSRYPRRGM